MTGVSQRWPLAAVASLVALAPFNVKAPPAGDWTDLQLRPLVVVALGTTVVLTWVTLRQARRRPDLVDALAYALLAAVWVSAAFGASFTVGVGGAVRFSVAALLIPLVRRIVQSRRDADLVLIAAAAGVIGAATLGLVMFGFGIDGSPVFVGRVTRLGPLDRLTWPWSHANVAAMSLGMALATPAVLPRAWMRAGGFTALTVALVLTVSRGGLLAAAATGAVWLMLRRSRPVAAAVGALAVVSVVVVFASPAWSARLDAGGDDAFYAAGIDAPGALVLDGADLLVDVTVTNKSVVAWPREGDERVLISARWIGPDGLVWTEDRWQLPATLGVGETLTAPLTLTTRVPPGTYAVRWDLLIDGTAYFDQFLGLDPITTDAEVRRSDVVLADLTRYDYVERFTAIGRVEGWRLALDEFRESPIVGVGPNQFGDREQGRSDEPGTVVGDHAHNVLLEPLATWGLLGTFPFIALGAVALQQSVARAWRGRRTTDVVIASGMTALVVHGLVDWPLVTVSTVVPAAVLVGLALASTPDS